MRYFLVGILDPESYNKVEDIQKRLNHKYDLYDKLPMLHLTLEVISDCDTESLISALKDKLEGLSKFIVQTNGAICFEPPFKSVNLLVQDNSNINDFILDLNSYLKDLGFSVREDVASWDLHISLANNNFSNRIWSQGEYESACSIVKSMNFKDKLIIDSIELWKPVNNIEEMILATFMLK